MPGPGGQTLLDLFLLLDDLHFVLHYQIDLVLQHDNMFESHDVDCNQVFACLWLGISLVTGDKQETAIEIGKSCQLIQDDMQLEILSSPNKEAFNDNLLQLIAKYGIRLGSKCTELFDA